MKKERLVINKHFNRAFNLLMSDCKQEINLLLTYLSVDNPDDIRQWLLDIDPQAKMILILLYHTGRDAMYMRFEHVDIQRAYLYQELYLNYMEFFLEEDSVGDSLDVDKEVDLVLSPYGTQQAHDRFHLLMLSKLGLFAVMDCLMGLSGVE